MLYAGWHLATKLSALRLTGVTLGRLRAAVLQIFLLEYLRLHRSFHAKSCFLRKMIDLFMSAAMVPLVSIYLRLVTVK